MSEDESRILVIRSGTKYDEELKEVRLQNEPDLDLFRDFPDSGVYVLPEKRLLYKITWFCLDRHLLAGADLMHLARLNQAGATWALRFYEAGRQIRSYSRDEILTAFSADHFFPFVTWDYYHRWHDDFKLTGATVLLTTVKREVLRVPIGYSEDHRFDLVTGTLESTEIHNGPLLVILLGGGGGLLAILGVVISNIRARRKKRRKKAAA